MTGIGSPCGACKFLRRKRVRGCVFAPYFCHEQGGTHFAAIYNVFGASNVSKHLIHLPVNERLLRGRHFYILRGPSKAPRSYLWLRCPHLCPRTTSYQSSSTANLSQGPSRPRPWQWLWCHSLTPQEDKLYQKFQPCQQDGQGFFQTGDGRMPPFLPNTKSMNYYNNELLESNCIQSSQMYNPHSGLNDEGVSFGIEDDPSCAMATLDMQPSTWTSAYHDTEDLRGFNQ